jgi:hypothetical protein
MTSAVNLTNAIKARLTFYARWALEANYDYVQVQASIDNGATWSPLCGKYTVEGSNFQASGEPLYEGFQNAWVQEEISLDDYIGYNVIIRFQLVSDGFLEYDGFYFDDFSVSKILPGTNSIDENITIRTPLVMPNPASEYVLVSFEPTNQPGNLLVTDLTGKIVKGIPYDGQESTIRMQTSTLNAGVYSVRLIQKDGSSKPVKLVVY